MLWREKRRGGNKVAGNLVEACMKKMLTVTNLIRFLGVWTAVATVFLFTIAALFMPPNARAVIFMSTGLVLLWVLLGGLLMWRWREPIRALVQRLPPPWPLTFVLFCTVLALLEEAVTVTMTNLAPLFGVPLGAAYITASANYLDVVLWHSVIVFVPMFIGWAILLRFWQVSPNGVFLVFGFTGFWLEAAFSGRLNLLQLGFWVFVYGLMVYLPAYCLPAREGAKPPKAWHYAVMVLGPVLLAIPVALIISTIHPTSIHFPPIVD